MQTDAECVRKRKEKPHVITTEYEDYERNMQQQMMAIMDAAPSSTSNLSCILCTQMDWKNQGRNHFASHENLLRHLTGVTHLLNVEEIAGDPELAYIVVKVRRNDNNDSLHTPIKGPGQW